MFKLDIEGGVARLVLDRPEARNAIPVGEWRRLAETAEAARRDGARLLLVSGGGGSFCAGADLGDFPAFQSNEAARAAFRQAMRDGLDRIRNLPLPTIASIEGPCFGAGVALAMACDIRVAGAGASFAITPARLGIAFPQEDVHRLVSLVGPGQAARLLFSGSTIDGREAERIGLVELFAGDDPAVAADALAEAILANSADSLATLKRGIRLAEEGVARDEAQDRRFDALFGSSDFAARLAASRPGRGG